MIMSTDEMLRFLEERGCTLAMMSTEGGRWIATIYDGDTALSSVKSLDEGKAMHRAATRALWFLRRGGGA